MSDGVRPRSEGVVVSVSSGSGIQPPPNLHIEHWPWPWRQHPAPHSTVGQLVTLQTAGLCSILALSAAAAVIRVRRKR